MTSPGDHSKMQRNADRLIEWLEVKYREKANMGWYLFAIAREMRWTHDKTRRVIDWCRNCSNDPRHQIYAFRSTTDGRRWAYKIPDLDQAIQYENARGRDTAVRAGHILFLVRKRAHLHGITWDTSRRTEAYTEMLRWLSAAGVSDAEVILEQALRPLEQVA